MEESAVTVLYYGRGRAVLAALVLVGVTVACFSVVSSASGSGPELTAFWVVVVLLGALSLNAIGIAFGPNRITLDPRALIFRRGFEFLSIPWSSVTKLESRRRRRGVPTHHLAVHVRQRSDIAFRGIARCFSGLHRSASPVIQIPLRAGIPLLVGISPKAAVDLIRMYHARRVADVQHDAT